MCQGKGLNEARTSEISYDAWYTPNAPNAWYTALFKEHWL